MERWVPSEEEIEESLLTGEVGKKCFSEIKG
jgi:hypothetical protein